MHAKTITDEAAHANALQKHETAKAALNSDENAPLGRAFAGLDMTTLSRYEADIERSLYKALHELQAARSG